jgi:hypothetical protein
MAKITEETPEAEDNQVVFDDEPPYHMRDVIQRAQDIAADVSELCKHVQAGLLDEYYQWVMNELVMDLTIIPVIRAMHEVETYDDSDTVTSGFHAIANILSAMFQKDSRKVREDLIELMNEFPVDDVREAYVLRQQNLLH